MYLQKQSEGGGGGGGRGYLKKKKRGAPLKTPLNPPLPMANNIYFV